MSGARWMPALRAGKRIRLSSTAAAAPAPGSLGSPSVDHVQPRRPTPPASEFFSSTSTLAASWPFAPSPIPSSSSSSPAAKRTSLPALVQPVLATGQPNPAIEWRPARSASLKEDIKIYRQLAKDRLSTLVVLTAMAGYAMCPVDPSSSTAALQALGEALSSVGALPIDLVPTSSSSSIAAAATGTNSLAVSVLLPTTVGTALCSASAASFNQLLEWPYDAQMPRTRARPLPRGKVSPLHATVFGLSCGLAGSATLAAVGWLPAALGVGTILLYAPCYTLLKRHTIYNTWLGSVLGALPPLIGWAACTGSIDPRTDAGAWLLFGVMYFWQFPHFNALAHTLRGTYAASGYVMLAAVDPAHNALVSLRYAAALAPLSVAFPLLGVTTWLFPVVTAPANAALIWQAWRFYRERTDKKAKQLFFASLIHLPIVLGAGMLCKVGLWDRWMPEWLVGSKESASEKDGVAVASEEGERVV